LLITYTFTFFTVEVIVKQLQAGLLTIESSYSLRLPIRLWRTVAWQILLPITVAWQLPLTELQPGRDSLKSHTQRKNIKMLTQMIAFNITL